MRVAGLRYSRVAGSGTPLETRSGSYIYDGLGGSLPYARAPVGLDFMIFGCGFSRIRCAGFYTKHKNR